jgi:hypothetical protein
MPAFGFKLETAEGEPADPPELATIVYRWKAGDGIPPGHGRCRPWTFGTRMQTRHPCWSLRT